MTLFRKPMTVVLTGVLVLAVAVALPFLPVFGEGGARRDVVLHELERNATIMDMLYLVEFEATQAGAPTSREQTIERLDKLVIPTLESLGKDGKVRAGGTAVGTLAGAFVVSAKSKDEVNELVHALPAVGIMQWKVTPLETFAHRADIEKKVVQGLRAQK
jgi:muconolactone delta-isomerase